MFAPHAIDRTHKVAVGNRVSRLLQLPQVFTQTRNCRRRIEDDLGAVESQSPRAFRKMTIVANIDTDVGKLRLEDRITEVARFEIELFPETRRAMGNMMLPVFSEIFAIGIDDRGSVVVDTF